MVAIREKVSWMICSSKAVVGDCEAFPTPKPSRMARFASRLVMEEEKACSESKVWYAR